MPQYFDEVEPEREPELSEGNAVAGIFTFFRRLTEPGGIWKYWKL